MIALLSLDWEKFLNFTVSGIVIAAIYAIAASGLVVTYTTSGVFNFAHGAFGMMAAFTYWQVHAPVDRGGWGWSTPASFAFVLLVAAPLFGVFIERVIMRGLEGASEVVKIVVTVSLMLALLGLQAWIWPSTTTRAFPRLFEGWKVNIAGTNITAQTLIVLGSALTVALLLRFVLYKTRIGVTMRAVVDDRALVQLNGGRPYRASMTAWALGTTLAALSGILVAPTLDFNPLTLTLMVVNAYAVAVFGKLKSLPLAFAGALILGLAESYCAMIIKSDQALFGLNIGNLKYAISPIFLFLLLVFQPQARLRSAGVQRVRESWRVPSLKLAAIGGVAIVVVAFALVDLIRTDIDRAPIEAGLIFAIAALSLVPLTGFAGQISLAQLSFVGIGAVVMNRVGTNGPTLGGAILAMAVCAIVGAIIALPALRLTGIYLALSTAAFSLFMTTMFFEQSSIMPGGTITVPGLDLGFFHSKTHGDQVILLAIVFAVLGVFVVWLRRSSMGRRLTAMKDSPVACATLGLDLTRTKIGVFSLSAAMAGLAGALMNRSVIPGEFALTSSMAVTMLAVVGGIGAVGGALFGGMLLGPFQTLVPTLMANNALGVFRFFEVAVKDLMRVAPGMMGISLGKNPSGAISQLGDAFRPVAGSREASAVAVGGPALLWLLARSGTINNWTFVACLVVAVLAVIPAVPTLIQPIPGGRALPAGMTAIAMLVGVGLIDWSTAFTSSGMRILGIFVAVGVTAAAVRAVHGAMPPLGAEPGPNPDMVGIHDPLSLSDVHEAERAIGVKEADFGPAA